MKRTRIINIFIVALLIFIVALLIFALLIFAVAYIHSVGKNTNSDNVKETETNDALDIRHKIEVKGGAEIVFVPSDEVDKEEITKEQLDTAKDVIEKRLIGENVIDYEVSQDYGNCQIFVRFLWNTDDESFDAESIIKSISETPALEFCRGTTREELVISGKNIVTATLIINEQTGDPAVSFELDKEGTEAFAKATAELAGTGTISIWLDGEMISNPTVQQAITKGEGVITGFTEDQAMTLANQLSSGALPFTLKTVENRTRIIYPQSVHK